ncbi:MAG: dipeptidase [Planctomycetes bacterium]|nr:dipeptidase [Planctomycetota bacterium]MBI3846367.1 dipeptidase [Planctomycetota bacterium]
MPTTADFITNNRERFQKELFDLLRIPSISTSPERDADTKRAAEFVRKQLQDLGFRAQLHTTPKHPIVTAESPMAAGKPTVLVYGHYDVQPPDPLGEWRHGPFEPTIEGENVIARGATDDKGQMFAHVKAVESIIEAEGKLPCNVKFLIEGEEEIGSPNLDPFIESHKDLLKCDVVVISDTDQFAPGQPAICYALRGLVYMEIEVVGPTHDLHSGMFGGSLDNPATVLARIIASFHDADHHVAIKGFYDHVRALTPDERAGFAELPFDEKGYREEMGVTELVGEKGFTTIERRWARPTCEINGIFGGFQGEGAKTVIPAKAGAKVSMRLVPDQDWKTIAKLFEEHVRSVAPKTVKVNVKTHSGSGPVLVPRDSAAVKAGMRALEKGFGKKPVFMREGGSIPVVLTFDRVLKVPVVLLGFGLPDDRAHSPNEKFNLGDYERGIRTSAHFLHEIAGGK